MTEIVKQGRQETIIWDCWISTYLRRFWVCNGFEKLGSRKVIGCPSWFNINIDLSALHKFSVSLWLCSLVKQHEVWALLRIFLYFSLYSYSVRILRNTIFLLKVRLTCGAESRTFELKNRSTVSRGQSQVWYVVRCIVTSSDIDIIISLDLYFQQFQSRVRLQFIVKNILYWKNKSDTQRQISAFIVSDCRNYNYKNANWNSKHSVVQYYRI